MRKLTSDEEKRLLSGVIRDAYRTIDRAEALPLVTALLVTTKGILGCCLRNVLESQCTSDAFVEDALERAVERRHRPCQELAYILSGMTRSQRSRLGYLGWREQGLASKRRQVEWLRDWPPKTAAR